MLSEPNTVHQVILRPELRQQWGRGHREAAEAAGPALSSLLPPGRAWSHQHPPTEPSRHSPLSPFTEKESNPYNRDGTGPGDIQPGSSNYRLSSISWAWRSGRKPLAGQERPAHERAVPSHSSQVGRPLDNVKGQKPFLLGLRACPPDSLISWLPLNSHYTPKGNHYMKKEADTPSPHPQA